MTRTKKEEKQQLKHFGLGSLKYAKNVRIAKVFLFFKFDFDLK